ncbi:MAG: hypothetical protein V7746_14245 [Halioglobus sp.]
MLREAVCRLKYKRTEYALLLLLVTLTLIGACSPIDGTGSDVIRASENRRFSYEVFLPKNNLKNPLIVFSHGSGGLYRNYKWLIETLVVNGFVVAALNHPFNNANDNTEQGVIRVWDRPKDMSLLIDELLTNPEWAVHIDPERIGAAGHSSGGYAAIALAGAIYVPELMEDYCSGSNRGPDCDLANGDVAIDYSTAASSYRDDRVKSVLAMAPAVGPAIDQGSLESINIPVFVMATMDDEILNFDRHAEFYAKSIPTAELRLLSGGGHFIYMECDVITWVADWFISNLDLCGSQFSIDRQKVRNNAGSLMVDFFNTNIGQQASAFEEK